MTLIHHDRTLLDAALDDPDTTVMVLSGDADSDAAAIHERIEDRDDMEPWRRWFLLTDLTVIEEEERQEWFDGELERFAVVGGGVPKLLGPWGTSGDLLRTNGKPSILRIRRAFAQGDQL